MALVLSGCVSANIETRFVTPYDLPSQSVLLVTRFEVPDTPFETAFATEIEAGLAARGVRTVAQQVPPDSANPTTPDASDVGASSLLVVELVDASSHTVAPGSGPGGMGMGTVSETQMDVSLSPVDVGRAIWKADLRVKGSGSAEVSEARQAARRLVRALEADGLIGAER